MRIISYPSHGFGFILCSRLLILYKKWEINVELTQNFQFWFCSPVIGYLGMIVIVAG